MNKIEFPRKGVDGIDRTKDEIEDWYKKAKRTKRGKGLKDEIFSQLSTIEPKTCLECCALQKIMDNLEHILIMSPKEMDDIIKGLSADYMIIHKLIKNGSDAFLSEIGLAFNYGGFRENVLVELAKRINVKTCPYCNMHYTLYAENGNHELARLQFDHFFSKKIYPMFSMTLYNLIPSCGVCNQGKSQGNLPIEFNPYHSNIHEQFNFRLDNPIEMYMGVKKSDDIAVHLSPKPNIQQTDVEEFDKVFHLSTLYRRLGDVAQEVFDKVYCDPYYSKSSNFTFLGQEKQYLERLYMGTYTDPKDIEKRPMTKFVQDMREQAFDEIQNGFLPDGIRRF